MSPKISRGSIRRDDGPCRKVATPLAEPILLEIQQREQEIFGYLSSDLEQQIAS